MEATWLVTSNGVTKSAAEWGIESLRRTRVSQAQDSVSFRVPGAFDAAPAFPVGSMISIAHRDTAQSIRSWFYGRVIQVPRAGAGHAESMDYVIAGPWWYLENLVYQQIWAIAPRVSPATLQPDEVKLGTKMIEDVRYDEIGVYKSRIILGQNQSGDRMTSAAVIQDVLAYAIDAGAPIRIGTIEPALEIPFDEQQDVTCAEVIRRMLRWAPDTTVWFDYSTTPPTFNCRRRADQEAATLAVTDCSDVQITARDDLVVPSVFLKYEQTNSIDGTTFDTVVPDRYPLDATGREFGSLIATLRLAGTQMSFLTQKIVSEEIPEFPGGDEGAFWRKHDASCKANEYQQTTVIAGTTETTSDPLQYELKEGQIQDWMTEYSAREVTYTAQVRTVTQDDGEVLKKEIRSVSCTIVTTNAKTGTYTRLASLVSGEPIPEGLARALYEALNQVQYAGTIVVEEEECGAEIAAIADLRAEIGRCVNLTGGQDEWKNMRAMIQQVDENVETGRTTITIGPAEHLSPQDLVERLRANRGRGVAYGFLRRQTGETPEGGKVPLSGPTPIVNTAGAAGKTEKMIIKGAGKIVLDPGTITAKSKELKVVNADVLVGDQVKRINVLASEDFKVVLPSIVGKSKYMVLQLTDNPEEDNTLMWVVDWLRAGP